MKYGKRQAALVFGISVLSVALLGGVTAAAFQPVDTQSTAHPERVEQAKPPLPDLAQILDQLVVAGRITATQREAILAAVRQFTDTVEEKRPAFSWKGHLEGYLRTSAAFLVMTEAELQTALRDGKSLAEVAAARGKTREALLAAIAAPANAKVDEALATGKMTAGQATAAKAQIAAAAGKLVDAKHEPKAGKDTKKDKQDKDKDKEERKSEQKLRIDVHKLLGDSLRSAVAYLGLEAKAVQEQLRSGKSLADVAAANGKTRVGLIDAISAAADTKVDELKAQNKLTGEQAARTKTQIAEAAAKVADAKTSVRKVTAPGQAKKRG